MSRVRTLSRTFMKGHPREGQSTFFVEKFLNSMKLNYTSDGYLDMLCILNEYNIAEGKLSFEDLESFWLSLQPVSESKNHTIRGKSWFAAGDKISIRCWFGKPYHGCQIILADDLEIKKVWSYEVKVPKKGVEQWFLNGTMVSENNEYMQQWFNAGLVEEIAKNDGLEVSDFLGWFKHPSVFSGQIICWDDSVKY